MATLISLNWKLTEIVSSFSNKNFLSVNKVFNFLVSSFKGSVIKLGLWGHLNCQILRTEKEFLTYFLFLQFMIVDLPLPWKLEALPSNYKLIWFQCYPSFKIKILPVDWLFKYPSSSPLKSTYLFGLENKFTSAKQIVTTLCCISTITKICQAARIKKRSSLLCSNEKSKVWT